MATFGENLRHQRELQGVTLPELAEATKVSLRHLTALENDQFDQLPGGVFSRGFVRSIARYLELDEHHWVGEFARAAHAEPEVLARYAPPEAPPGTGGRRGLVGFIVLAIAFGVGAYWVHGLRQQQAVTAPVPAGPPAQTSTATEPAPVEPASGTSAATGSPAAAPAKQPETYAAPHELRLQVDVMQEAWVSVSVDGRQFFTGVMKPGESRTFRGVEQIELTTGNASAVILTLNGETLPPLGNPGERRNVTLTARDLPPRTF